MSSWRIRSPCRTGGRAAPGTHSKELVNFVDLAPTVLSLAGVAAPAYFQGRAFAGPARKPAPDFTFTFRGRMDERYDFSRAVNDGRYRYIRHYLPHRPAGQHVGYLWQQASMAEWDQLFRAGKLNAEQRVFFVATAPLAPNAHINTSPKGATKNQQSIDGLPAFDRNA